MSSYMKIREIRLYAYGINTAWTAETRIMFVTGSAMGCYTIALQSQTAVSAYFTLWCNAKMQYLQILHFGIARQYSPGEIIGDESVMWLKTYLTPMLRRAVRELWDEHRRWITRTIGDIITSNIHRRRLHEHVGNMDDVLPMYLTECYANGANVVRCSALFGDISPTVINDELSASRVVCYFRLVWQTPVLRHQGPYSRTSYDIS